MNTIEILNKIKNENSTNAKIDILKNNADNKLLLVVLKLAYDQNIVFGIKKIPDPDNSVPQITLTSALKTVYQELNEKRIRGNAAQDLVSTLLGGLSAEEQDWLSKILKKDLKIGINRKTIEKVFPGMFERFGYMGAVPFSRKKFDKLLKHDIIIVQEKMDGEYSNLQLEIKNDKVSKINFYSRQNKLQRLPAALINRIKNDVEIFIKQYRVPNEIVFNGELLIDRYDRFTSNGLLSRIFKYGEYQDNGEAKKAQKALKAIEEIGQAEFSDIVSRIKYFIWDFIDEKQQYKYIDRWDLLTDHSNPVIDATPFFKPVETIIIDQLGLVGSKIKYKMKHCTTVFPEDFERTEMIIKNHFNKIVLQGGEGLVVKSGEGMWKDGKPVYQIKMKAEFECEMKIVGFKPGTPGTKYENSLGALICESEDGKVKADPSGITDDLRDEIWNNKDEFLNKIITVRFNALTKSKDNEHYSLMHPRFVKLRTDKDKADNFETVKQIADISK